MGLEFTKNEVEPIDDGLLGYSCIACGKEFFPTPVHKYRDAKGKYCCWTCFNHRNDGKTSRWQAVECLYMDGTYVRTFRSINQAAEWIGSASNDAARLRDAIINDKPYKGYLWRFKKNETHTR